MSTTTHDQQSAAAARELGDLSSTGPRFRLDSIDLMRGIVMVLMLLDHTKDLLGSFPFDPMDVDATDLPSFFTRWISHFCAPTFCFLMGTGAYLAGRNRTKSQLSWFLFTRGLWLIFLEFTVVKFGLFFNYSVDVFLALVFWSLGCSLIFLSAIVFLPTRVVGGIGVLMILTHNLLDGVNAEMFGSLRPLWMILHERGPITLSDRSVLIVGYPLIPWLGVAAAGFGFGEIVKLDTKRRRAIMISLGLAMTAAFFLLRALDVYGDPLKWSHKASTLWTCFSFLNCLKYPPSLLFLLMTLGPMIALLAILDRNILPALISRFLLTFGRVPLFFFVAQWYVLNPLAIVVAVARGYSPGSVYMPPTTAPPGVKFDLPMVYFWFVVALIILYFPCRWFAGVKARHKDVWWLSYL
jgi:uncharacterized membrane protein